ncbi:hypothetical protein WI372_01985 [Gemmatimonadota bacterium DH-20]|uniref:Uncharacterized protein n=1 Tax=Gaopeijia maritima TaxID=3119007 RepID=A0ABU9E703_9BACT
MPSPPPRFASIPPGTIRTDRPPALPPTLLIEGTSPRFPVVYRRWLGRSSRVDVALTRLRIATLRLQAGDLARVERLRIVLAELSTAAWEAETHRALLDPQRGPMLRRIIQLLQEGRLEVRSAPLAGWAPDFTIFHDREPGEEKASPARALIGPHWLETGAGLAGPRFAFAVEGVDARRAQERFTSIWRHAYDVGPAVTRLLGGTMEALDRLTPSIRQGIVSAPQHWGVLPP